MNHLEDRPHHIILEGLKTLYRIFWGPNPDQCRMILSGDFISVFELIDQESEINIHDSINKLKSMIRGFEDPEYFSLRLNEEYVGLFISHKDGIAAPLYESCYEYENAPLMGPPAIRMKERFESAGLTISENFNEPPDHLCLELEYLYFLLETAWNNERIDQLKQAEKFISEVLIQWVEPFYKKLASAAPDSFYTHSAALLREFLRSIQRLLSHHLVDG